MGGTVVEVTLSGTEANVRLLDSHNFSAFKARRSHRYVGGHTRHSPVRLKIPHGGHWYLTIDYGGCGGRGRASVSVLLGHLSPFRERALPSLAPIGESLAAMSNADALAAKEWDVFISHAGEDKG